MARRAALFKKLRKQKTSVLALAGGFEFSKKNSQVLAPLPAAKLVQAFELLDYEFGVLDLKESRLLDSVNIDLPENWLTCESDSIPKILDYKGKKVGILVFPKTSQFKHQSALEIFNNLNQKAEHLKSRVNILIGLSLWGSNLERQYLQNTPVFFDILLGSGPGSGFAGKYRQNKKTLWVRPYDKGKTVNIINILEWPKIERPKDWILDKNIKSGLAKLSDNTPEDPEMTSIFSQSN